MYLPFVPFASWNWQFLQLKHECIRCWFCVFNFLKSKAKPNKIIKSTADSKSWHKFNFLPKWKMPERKERAYRGVALHWTIKWTSLELITFYLYIEYVRFWWFHLNSFHALWLVCFAHLCSYVFDIKYLVILQGCDFMKKKTSF